MSYADIPRNRNQLEFSLKLQYPVLIAGLLLTACAGGVYWYKTPPANFDVKTLLQVLGAGTGLTGLFFTAINLQILIDGQIRSFNRERLKVSYDLIAEWESHVKSTTVALKLRKSISGKNPVEIETAISQSSGDPSISNEQAIVSVLNFFEKVSQTIRSGYSDEASLKDFFKGLVIGYYHDLKGYILYVREKKKNDRVFEAFFEMAKSWEK